jgi:hypothetical protein
MRDVLVGVGVGVEVDQRHRLVIRQARPLTGDPLQDRPGDRVVAADRHRPRFRVGDAPEEGADPLDARLVVHRLRQRHVAQVVDAARLPRREVAERLVQPPVVGRDVAHRARPEVLIPLRRAVAGGVRHPDQGDIEVRRIGIDRAAKEGGHALPIERFEQNHLVVVRGHARPPISLLAVRRGRS